MVDLRQLLDLTTWHDIQNRFSHTAGVPFSTIDLEGNEIAYSKNNYFFLEIIRSKANELYKNLRKQQIEQLKRKQKTITYTCEAVLTYLMSPIYIKNILIGATVAGPFKISVNQDKINTLANAIKLGPEELRDAVSKIPKVMEEEKLQSTKMLELLTTTIPKLIAQKKNTDKRIKELEILQSIATMMSGTLEFSKILKSIIEFMITSVDAKDCSILIFEGNKRYSIKQPANNQNLVEATIARDVRLTGVATKVPSIRTDFRFENLKLPYNAAVGIPLKVRSYTIGAILLFGNDIRFDESDYEFLTAISNQAATAIYNAQQFTEVKESAITDKLTGLYNRRHFMDVLKNEVQRSKRHKHALSVTLFDIDHFKHYNDKNGHIKGDVLLKQLSEIITKNVRTVDTVGRFGGEEFIIVLPETKMNEAKVVAERIRKAVENTAFDHAQQQPLGKVSISLGLVTCMNGTLNEIEVIKESDKNLYKAKSNGRNRTVASIILDKNMQPVEVLE